MFQLMAPELFRSATKYNKNVDIYLFGVLVFYILTGGKYPKIGPVEIANGKNATILDCINEISKQLILKCWSSTPEDRPTFNEIIEFIKKKDFMLVDEVKSRSQEMNSFYKTFNCIKK